MRHVYANPPSLDSTFAQQTCRKWMRGYLKDFMAVKSRMEEAAFERDRSASYSMSDSDADEADREPDQVEKLLYELTAMNKAKKQ